MAPNKKCSKKKGENQMRIRTISQERINSLREIYPRGTRVKLLQMDDVKAPPVGTTGTVFWVDDTGNILVDWDNGSCLNIVYGIDSCVKINENRQGA